MSTFSYRTELKHSLPEVFSWHERPGAFRRLTPPTFGEVLHEPTVGIRDGSRAKLKVFIPATFGRLGMTWTAQHQGYVANEKFEDIMVKGPLKSWHHVHRFESSPHGTVIHDDIEYELPVPAFGPVADVASAVVSRQMRQMFSYRQRQLCGDLAFHAAHLVPPRTIVITGAGGLIGTQLSALLSGGGHEVRVLTRSQPAQDNEYHWDPARGELDPTIFEDVDVVIHLAGEPVAGRFTPEHKHKVMSSRVAGTELLARTLAEVSSDGIRRALIGGSASGYYGSRGEEVLTENSMPGDGFLAEVCQAWEAATEQASEAGVRVVHVRTGIVQSPAGGQLALQLPIFEVGGGGPLGDGQQWMPWVALDDIIGIFAHAALRDDVEGPVNGCAPEPVRGNDYARILASVLNRPNLIRVPEIGPKILLGDEGADELALASAHMSTRADDLGYEFRFTDLRSALQHLLSKR